MGKSLQKGDPVCWSSKFLSQTGSHTSVAASRCGVVKDFGTNHLHWNLVLVLWDDGPIHWCRRENLLHADRKHLEPR